MSYTDYLKRMVINTPKVIDTQLRLPDASSYTWRKKLESTLINRRTDHVINNSQDLGIAPRLFSPAVRGYPGTGFGGKVQDASSYTLSRGAHAIGRDTFRAANGTRRIHTVTTSASGECLTRTPASQVVSELGNAEESLSGLNMGYTRQRRGSGDAVDQVGQCTAQFRPLTKSHFVDTIPDVKFHKSGTAPQPVTTQTDGGRQNVQNPIIFCTTTNTSGVAKSIAVDAAGIGLQNPKADVPFNSYFAPPKNAIGSGPNRVHGAFVTSPTGPQVGGQTRGGVRADKVGGVSVVQKGTITHRGWGGRTRTPYPYMGREGNQPPAPAQLKINDPNHYKVK
jgi:hypothetical protein